MKQFSDVEIGTIGEKITEARKKLIAEGFNPHPRFSFLFREQIARMAGVTAEEWDAYTFSRIQVVTDADRERRSLRGRLRRFGDWLHSTFGSTKLA